MSVVARNKKAYFNYSIEDKYIAGIVLKGYEVKSVVNGKISLKESFVRVHNGEVWLHNAHISKWEYANLKDYDPTRTRKLLLKKREINSLLREQNQNRKSIVPLKVILKNKKIKLILGVGKGKKKYDKREAKKKKDLKRRIKADAAGEIRF